MIGTFSRLDPHQTTNSCRLVDGAEYVSALCHDFSLQMPRHTSQGFSRQPPALFAAQGCAGKMPDATWIVHSRRKDPCD